jgi:hydroxymethylbilane synthase
MEKLLRTHPGLTVELVTVKTQGDKILDVPLASVGGKGLFVKEIEDALLREEVDLAVHSMKDLPATLPDGLDLAAIPEREDPRDALISKNGKILMEIPTGGTIGTGSLRRRAQLLQRRPDLNVVNLRGNLDTRIRKLESEGLDGIVVAAAGLRRMGWTERVTEIFSPETILPAVGQGALGIEIKSDRRDVSEIVAVLDHPPTRVRVEAERAFLKSLEGGCQVPIAGHASLDGETLRVEGLVSDLAGRRVFRGIEIGDPGQAVNTGKRLAVRLLQEGAGRILEELYAE